MHALVRTFDYESEGRRFESYRAYQGKTSDLSNLLCF